MHPAPRRIRPRGRAGLALSLLGLGALLTVWPGAALDPSTPPNGYVHRSWKIADGLPQSSVTDIVRTRDGYLWVATFGGLARFDGIRFKVFDVATAPGLGSNRLLSLHEDRRGVLWIGSEEGLLIRYEDGRFSTLGPADGLPSNTAVWDLLDDAEGTLWIATSRGLYLRHGGGARSFEMATGIGTSLSSTALALDPEERLFVATERGIASRSQQTFDLHPFPGEPQRMFLQALIATRQGLMWLRNDVLGVFEDGRYEVLWEPETTTSDPRALLEDRDGNLWLASQGLVRLNGSPGRRSAQRVLDVHARALYEDREGDLWIGTNSSGLHLLRDSAFTNVAHPTGTSARVVTETAAGEILIGFGCEGLWSWNGEALSPVQPPEMSDGCVSAVLEDHQGRLWVGTHLLTRRDGGIWSTFTDAHGLPEKSAVQALYEDRRGRIWIGSQGGLGRFEEGRIQVFTPADGLAGEAVRFITEDRRGDLWIGGPDGLTHFAGGQVAATAARRYTVEDGLPHNFIRAVHEAPDGALWIGTYGGGLARFDRTARTFAVLTSHHGLAENTVSRILEDGAAQLWLSGNRGITRLDRAEAEAFLHGERDRVVALLYDEADGMAVAETNGGSQPAGWRTRDGVLWFPTLGGAAALDPARLRSGPPPPVTIETVRVGRREIAADGRLVVPPGKRDLEISYVGLQLGLPDEVTYRYRLLGDDAAWVDVGHRRTAYYTGLDPGEYRFEVTAAAHVGGTWNPLPATLEVVVEPLVRETWWFRAAVSALALALIAGGVSWHGARRRNAELGAINAELEVRNAEMERFTYTVSHDLKSPLITIKGFLGLLARDLEAGQLEKVAGDLEQIQGATQTMLQLLANLLELSRVGRVVGPSQEVELGELAREAVELTAGRISERGVEVVIAPHLPRVTGDRVRLLEVMQNLIENAVKYMGDQRSPRIEVDGAERGDGVVWRVRDNGAGIDAPYLEKVFDLFTQLDPRIEGTGIGLALVRRIVESHGGKIWAESDGPGQGSTFQVLLPAAAPKI